MSSKKKLIISLSVAAAVLVAAVIAIVAVFAATSQTVATSTIRVAYRAGENVVGSASASYSFYDTGSKETVSHLMTTDGEGVADGNDVISFDVDKAATGSLRLQNTDLQTYKPSEGAEYQAFPFSTETRELVITFTFTNTGSTEYTAILTPNITTPINMVVRYSADGSDWSATEPSRVVVGAPAAQGAEAVTKTYYVKIYIDNLAYDADFEGTFSWDLTTPSVTPAA